MPGTDLPHKTPRLRFKSQLPRILVHVLDRSFNVLLTVQKHLPGAMRPHRWESAVLHEMSERVEPLGHKLLRRARLEVPDDLFNRMLVPLGNDVNVVGHNRAGEDVIVGFFDGSREAASNGSCLESRESHCWVLQMLLCFESELAVVRAVR